MKRDRKVTKELRKAGWSVCRIWECKLKKPNRSLTRIQKRLEKTKPN
jgi:G:T-mismatch repair DNA endonuclease (very short patch repair protein)